MACPVPIAWDYENEDDWRLHRVQHGDWYKPAPEGRRVYVDLRDPIDVCLEDAEELLVGTDDEDAPLPASEVALRRAQRFVRKSARAAKRMGRGISVPMISLGPDRSVDVLWRAGTFEVLVNFPPVAEEPATFYGDDKSQQVIRGSIAAEQPLLLPWLITP